MNDTTDTSGLMMDALLEETARRFTAQVPAVDAWSLRLVSERRESLAVRQDVVQPADIQVTRGAGRRDRIRGDQ